MGVPAREKVVQRMAGGWTTDTSPDGRITMMVGPNGQRLSRSEFADQYPLMQAFPGSEGAALVQEAMHGGALQNMTSSDPNVKSGIVLVPGHKSGTQRRIAMPSQEFHRYDAQIQAEREALGRMDQQARTPIGKELRERGGVLPYLQRKRADAYSAYQIAENPGVAEADLWPTEVREYDAALRRGQGIPFPDRQTPIRNNPPRSDTFKKKLVEMSRSREKQMGYNRPPDEVVIGWPSEAAPNEMLAAQEQRYIDRQHQDFFDGGPHQNPPKRSPAKLTVIENTSKSKGK